MNGRVLVVDNRDSFVFNLVDELARRGLAVRTVRGNLSVEALEGILDRDRPDFVVLSPGPGRPEDAGAMVPWLRTDPAVPVLGVCLGHQAIAVAAGGRLARARRPVHGRATPVRFRADPLVGGEPGVVLVAARYHSLVVADVPPELEVVATTDDDERVVMAVRHRRRLRVGLQFHPESILTPQGGRLLERFAEEALRSRARRQRAPGDRGTA